MITTGSLARASVFFISKLRRVAPKGTRTWAVFTRECRVSVATMVQVACSLPSFSRPLSQLHRGRLGNVLGRWTSCQLASGLAASSLAQSVSEKTVLANNVTVLSENPVVEMRVQHGCGGGTGDGTSVLSSRVMISTGSLARASVFVMLKLRRGAPMGTRTWAVFSRECKVSVATMVQVAGFRGALRL